PRIPRTVNLGAMRDCIDRACDRRGARGRETIAAYHARRRAPRRGRTESTVRRSTRTRVALAARARSRFPLGPCADSAVSRQRTTRQRPRSVATLLRAGWTHEAEDRFAVDVLERKWTRCVVGSTATVWACSASFASPSLMRRCAVSAKTETVPLSLAT